MSEGSLRLRLRLRQRGDQRLKLTKMPEIPKKIELPGFAVEVRTATDVEMRQLAGHDVNGCWLESQRLIILNRDRPNWEMLRTFYHELKHAVVDAEHYVRCKIVEPIEYEAMTTALDMADDE
jgi:hypothetical protein